MKQSLKNNHSDTSIQKQIKVCQFRNKQKWERRDDLFSFQYCTKPVCLDIKKKINVLEKFNLLVRTLNMNDDDNHRWELPGNYPYFQKIW